jgi:hypothetical protein
MLARLLLPVPPIAAAPVLHALMMSSLYWRVVNLGGTGGGAGIGQGSRLGCYLCTLNILTRDFHLITKGVGTKTDSDR